MRMVNLKVICGNLNGFRLVLTELLVVLPRIPPRKRMRDILQRAKTGMYPFWT